MLIMPDMEILLYLLEAIDKGQSVLWRLSIIEIQSNVAQLKGEETRGRVRSITLVQTMRKAQSRFLPEARNIQEPRIDVQSSVGGSGKHRQRALQWGEHHGSELPALRCSVVHNGKAIGENGQDLGLH